MNQSMYWIKMIAVGMVAGLINGLFGAGGGTIIVPALTLLFGITQHKAHATAISVILPFAIVSSLVYFHSGVADLDTTLWITLGGMVGSFFGSRSLTRFSSDYLRKIFGVFMILAAIRMVLR